MKYFLNVFIPFIVALSGSSNEKKNNSIVDVFPIEPGIKYSYSIYRYGSSGDEMVSSSSKDSGRVDYVVIDSTASNDTTIVWNILEIHDYWRTQASNLSHTDTTYKVSDTLNLQLYEKRTGNHELQCSGMIWQFPLRHIRSEKYETVFRYTDTTERTMSWNWENQWAIVAHGSGTDSVFLSEKSGFHKRYFHENWYSGYLWGNTTLSIYSLHDPITSISREKITPHSIYLEQNYPNPFNPRTTIVFGIRSYSYVKLEVYDLLGKKIETLQNEYLQSGDHSIIWNADKYSSGIYFYRLSTSNYSITKKLVLLK